VTVTKKLTKVGISTMLILAGLSPVGYRNYCMAGQGRSLTSYEMVTPLANLESLEAEYHSANNIVSVKGLLKNTSNSVIRGFLSLHILSVSGNVLKTFELPLKDNQPLAMGESVNFEAVLPVAKLKGAAQISVDFTRN
jgi:hypothetical protein